ncbi:MAG TPA: DNA recombination protein RmuC [Dongiaceae bacterium]|jgi:DNA recombination protein RmuC|nr:DNA recombination protein RmuC [Dongiaceae bacterium]
MSQLPLVFSGLAVLGVLLLVVLHWRHRPQPALPDPRVDTLAGQLQQLAAQQSGAQAAIDRRLTELGDRVADRLQQSAAQAGQSLSELKERLAVIDAAQKNITELSTQVVGLQDILSNKQTRGAFGETQLADIVKTVLAPANYEFQATVGGNRRVDCLLKLPNPPGSIGIDAKFPLEAYRALRDAKDEIAMAQAKREFQTAIRGHVKAIAEKYIVPGETAESALLFLPSEAVYAELHATFPHLVEEAGKSRVWIVSPTTLMATLTTIRSVLRDVNVREQAHIIQKKVSELRLDVGRLDDRVDKLQRHFKQANDDIDQIRISTDKVLRRAGEIESVELEERGGRGAVVETLTPRIGQA